MKKHSPHQLSDGISTVLQELGIGKEIKRYEVIHLWQSIVGEQIAKVAVPDHIRGDRLYVRVSKPTWRNELLFLKKDLIDKINSALHENVIGDIIFR